MGGDSMDVTMASPPEEKVRLFRAMFRGREDVYARRYASAKSGKCGYSPVCAVEWTRGICDKKRVSCAVCPNRRFVPLDDEAVRMHLTSPGRSSIRHQIPSPGGGTSCRKSMSPTSCRSRSATPSTSGRRS